ncbi:MAG: glycoside hydrolase family 30 protein [Phycisphaerales bacterium]
MHNIGHNNIRIILTCKDSQNLLSENDTVTLTKKSYSSNLQSIELDTSRTFQVIKGFGGAFTEAGAYALSQVNPKLRQEVLKAYFDDVNGIGYSLCRTHINSCDFSLNNYSFNDTPDDYKLENFDIEHDRKLLIPFIKDAMQTSKTGFKLFASPWSPPAWMKTNGQMNNGGKLKPQCRNAWALYFAKYIKAYMQAGIPIWAVTVQNEPDALQRWDSCLYSNSEERDFLKFYLGPTLAEQGLSHIKIIVWDHNKDILVERISTILSDPEAAKYVWGIGFHWYAGTFFENLAKVHKFFPDKQLLATEGCHEGGVKPGNWQTGETYGNAIIGDLNNWAVGWVDWNMVLDETGGPNHADNFCDAPIIADKITDKIHYHSSYYYLGHFSKFIRPGAIRIQCETMSDKLQATAFQNQNGIIAAVVMNRSEEKNDFCLKIKDYAAQLTSPAHSIQTLLINQ